jgi:hypothetical protein
MNGDSCRTAAAPRAFREGSDFCERRGIAGFALGIAASKTVLAADCGLAEQALAEAQPLVEPVAAAGTSAPKHSSSAVRAGLARRASRATRGEGAFALASSRSGG